MSTVSYRNVTKKYGSVLVLEDINLDIPEGEFAVLLGASGCGKSTLLRMTAGLETITSGEIAIGGGVVNDVHPRDRDIAMVFQNYALYPQMKVFDNIAFALQIKKLPKAEIAEKVRWAADMLNMSDYLDRLPKELSGGQRQRVAMGRAIVRDPRVFLFDEPLSNLDAKLRAHMRYEIKRLHSRLETTTIYVTHDQIEAMTMADKIVVMHGGGIAQIGPPEEIFDKPINSFVAGFVGSPTINLLEGELAADNGRPFCRVGKVMLPVPADIAAKPGHKVIYGIRPLHMSIDAGMEESIQARIILSESTGSESEIYVNVDGCELTVLMPGRHHFEPDQPCNLTVDTNNVHIFDLQTGQRINS